VLSPAASRTLHADPAYEQQIATQWSAQIAAQPQLFNGSKFRLSHYTETPASSTAALHASTANTATVAAAVQQRRSIALHIALTDYRTFRGTEWAPHSSQLRSDGASQHGSECAHLSRKLGVSCALLTADGCLVLIVRSKAVAEGKGLGDTPGGHPEPAKVHPDFADLDSQSCSSSSTTGSSTAAAAGTTNELCSASDGTAASSVTAAAASLSTAQGLQQWLAQRSAAEAAAVEARILQELFSSVLDEAEGEVNVPRSTLSAPLLLGVVHQTASGGAPSAAFAVCTSLTAAQVCEHYAEGPAEAFESTRLVLLDSAQLLLRRSVSECLAEHAVLPTPALEGTLSLWVQWQLMLQSSSSSSSNSSSNNTSSSNSSSGR
jgi:hypothetical protein